MTTPFRAVSSTVKHITLYIIAKSMRALIGQSAMVKLMEKSRVF